VRRPPRSRAPRSCDPTADQLFPVRPRSQTALNSMTTRTVQGAAAAPLAAMASRARAPIRPSPALRAGTTRPRPRRTPHGRLAAIRNASASVRMRADRRGGTTGEGTTTSDRDRLQRATAADRITRRSGPTGEPTPVRVGEAGVAVVIVRLLVGAATTGTGRAAGGRTSGAIGTGRGAASGRGTATTASGGATIDGLCTCPTDPCREQCARKSSEEKLSY
jgi:hypothetical protein